MTQGIMDQESKQQKPLAISNNNLDIIDIKEAFEGDLLGRKKTADQLTGYLDRLRAGAVLAIDAPWGEGKTWFGRHWVKSLQSESNKHKVVYIDAFAQDYVEDPFLLITAEIAAALNDSDKATSELIQKGAAGVLKAILPIGTKILLNTFGRWVIGSTDLQGDLKEAIKDTNNEAIDATSKLIKKKLEDYTQEKESLKNFRKTLTEFCAKEDKPVVIFIDELDRCRPTFAVQLIERIKHLFDVPNLVFVLLINRKQLENAIEGVYGSGTDAATYLGKFVNLFLRLPKNYSINTSIDNHTITKFIVDVLKRYDYKTCLVPDSYFTDPIVNKFRDNLSLWARVVKDMSLRDIEHACALFVMSNEENRTGLLTYLIVLKIKYIEIYDGLVRNDPIAHENAIKFLSNLYDLEKLNKNEWSDLYFKILEEIHQLHLGVFKSIGECQYYSKYGKDEFGGYYNKPDFEKVFSIIDLPIELK